MFTRYRSSNSATYYFKRVKHVLAVNVTMMENNSNHFARKAANDERKIADTVAKTIRGEICNSYTYTKGI